MASGTRLVDLNIDDKKIANDVQRLGKLEIALGETPWYRFGTRKKLQDEINHLEWQLFMWGVSYRDTTPSPPTS
jgi:hypothetical protein